MNKYIMSKSGALQKYSLELLKYLNLSDKPYTQQQIKEAVYNKSTANCNLKNKTVKTGYICLDDEGKKLFSCYGEYIRYSILAIMIQDNFTENPINKPNCLYYEYNQKPTYVLSLD